MKIVDKFKIIALPVCLFTFGLTSCEKDEPELNPGGPTEQVLPGTAGEVTEAVTTEGGYALSYRSCIALPEGGSAEVDLTASLPASGTTTEEIVSNWDYAEEAAINSVYSGEFNREENGFIITDSLLVYTVSYGTFELTFEFPYETAQYDGTDVPEYRFEIKDKGGKFELIDSKERDGKAYALREYTHTVEAVFGGKSYDVEAEIVLRRVLGLFTGPYPLRCEVVDKSIEPLSTRDGFLSSITIKSAMSDGTEAQETYSRELYVHNTDPTRPYKEVFGSYDNLQYEGMSYKNGKTEYSYGYNDYFHLYEISDTCVFHYNYVDVDIVFAYQTAVFDNGVICEKMENYTYDSDKVVITSENWEFDGETDEYANYYLVLKANNFINGLPVEGIYSGAINFLK